MELAEAVEEAPGESGPVFCAYNARAGILCRPNTSKALFLSPRYGRIFGFSAQVQASQMV